MKTFPLRVLAPERTFFDGACTSLTVPSIDGIYGLMAQHEDIVLAIVPGKLTLRDADGVEQIAAVSEGVLKMEHGEALVLVDTIERPEEIDAERARRATGRTIYILDEPTTGLHSADVHKLIEVLQRLVESGNTVVVIEHNLDVIKTADWLLDLGPEGGDRGGAIVGQGTPEQVAQVEGSYTGQYLKRILARDRARQQQPPED